MVLAPYAVRPETSRGRLYPEAGGDTRSPFQRDRDRIIHATSFRRLQYKTQVFVYHEGDHFRTRLTHSIEVAQIARSIARLLHLDEDIAEALALAHDLGHPPFGHAGEDALNSAMKPYGGFDHNAQSLKVVTQLEARYAGFDGLNLTWETLEGLAKHNGPLRRPSPYIAEYDAIHPLELATHASAEAQIAALADDIAYNNHDLDDGLRARLFTLEEVGALPLIGDADFFICNTDAVWLEGPQSTIAAMKQAWRPDEMDVLLLVAPTSGAVGVDWPGDFHMAPDGRLTKRAEREVSAFVYAGVGIVKASLFEDAREEVFRLAPYFFRAAEAGRLHGLRLSGLWLHVGTPEAIEDAERAYARPAA